MNKQINLLSALAAFLLVSLSAQAADTAELKVRGVIRPPACTPSLAGNGVVDYGTIPAKSLKPGAYTQLPEKQISITVTCSSPIKVALTFTDNRAASRVSGILTHTNQPSQDIHNFGLGTVEGRNVGGYALSLAPGSTVDGKAATSLYSKNSGSSWTSGVYYLTNNGYYFSFNSDASSAPGSLQVLNANINVYVGLNKPGNLNLTKDVPLDGSATIEVKYL